MAETKPVEPDRLSVAKVCDLFLEWSRTHHIPETTEWHRNFLQSFHDTHGSKPAPSVIPHHLTTRLDAHPKWFASRRRDDPRHVPTAKPTWIAGRCSREVLVCETSGRRDLW